MNKKMKRVTLWMWTLIGLIGVWMWLGIFSTPIERFAQTSSLSTNDLAGIRQLIQQREWVVREGNWEDWKDWLDASSKSYFCEQKRWFDDVFRKFDRKSFRLALEKVVTNSQGVVIHVRQTYAQQGKQVNRRYKVVVRFDQKKQHWVEVEHPFFLKQSSWGTLKADDPKLLKKENLYHAAITKGRDYFTQTLGWKSEPIEIKLFQQADHFAQSVKLSLPTWVGGWNEANQAIKLVSQHNIPSEWEKAGIIHELSHHVVSDLTNDNAAYWLQEGAAMYYEELLSPSKSKIQIKPDQIWSRQQLEMLNLESLSDQHAMRFYLSCLEQYRRLQREIGDQGLRALFAELRKFNQIDLDSSEKIQVCNHRTNEALQKIYYFFKKGIDHVI